VAAIDCDGRAHAGPVIRHDAFRARPAIGPCRVGHRDRRTRKQLPAACRTEACRVKRQPRPRAESTKEKPASGKAEKGKTQNGKHTLAPLGKVLVNIAGSMGSRYLMANLTLVGDAPDLTERVESNKDQLMDLASGVLYSKSISDLEQPGARNLIRNELRMVFNNALGEGVVQEIYITEFVIQ
jgi:flagellar basal body-associated protein FliL